MTEYESERERLALITDLRLTLKRIDSENAKEGKREYQMREIIEYLDEFAEGIKQHK